VSARALLQDLRARGVTLTVTTAGRLHFRAPRGVLTDADRTALVRDKPELLALLAAESAARRTVLPLDAWDAEVARTLIQATVRRVDVAWAALPPEQRDPALQAHLGGTALAPIEAARQRRDMLALRRALAVYEAEAAPLFEASRSRTEVSL
jgi:hypothetical protein